MNLLMSDRALSRIRRTTERWMTDEIEVWRGTDSSLDQNTLIESTVAGTMVYSGKARIRPTRGPREQPVADGVLAMRDADVLTPIDSPVFHRDDEIKVVSAQDPVLVGKWLRVTDVRLFSQQPARKVSAIMAQPSRLWPES